MEQNIKRYETVWGDRPLVIEFGRLAGQATQACTVQYGDTFILATVVISDNERGLSYFPLQVEYRESMYAAGKISGSRFIKREGRPSDQSVLSGRIIDRSIRPLFDQRMRKDIQVVTTVLAYDVNSDPDVVALIGAAAALMTSNIPWAGPLAGCVVASKAGEMHLNPGAEILNTSDLNVFVSGRNMETVMLEADGRQATEERTLAAIEFGLKALEPVITLLEKIQKEIGQPKIVVNDSNFTPEQLTAKTEGETAAKQWFTEHMADVFGPGNKHERQVRYHATVNPLKAKFTEEQVDQQKFAALEFERLFQAEMVRRIFADGKRVDGRAVDEIRQLSVDTGLIPRVHGSALFSRGDTQVMSIVTLSSPSNEQIFDTMRLDEKRRYFHHYNFPPYSVGEAGPFRGAGRREIGHGALAEKALLPVLPPKEKFPYTMRVVSEVLSSNGSSSQGSICGSSLSLMDAGVPISAAVAGVAMGIAINGSKDKYQVLTDVQDVEDHDQSMDFKVGGTRQGITAIQLDIKFDGLTWNMVRDTIAAAKVGRLKILDAMDAVLAQARPELSPNAPRIEIMQINPERIGELIGPGGKVINGIIDATGVAIDIEDSGQVYITATNPDAMKKAMGIINDLLREVEVGEIVTGTVVKIVTDRNDPRKQIGAIVELGPNLSGMIHISQVDTKRIDKVSDVLKEGDSVTVKVMEIDRERGRIALSRKAMLEDKSNNLHNDQ